MLTGTYSMRFVRSSFTISNIVHCYFNTHEHNEKKSFQPKKDPIPILFTKDIILPGKIETENEHERKVYFFSSFLERIVIDKQMFFWL